MDVDAGGPYLIFVEGGTSDPSNGDLNGAVTDVGGYEFTTYWNHTCSGGIFDDTNGPNLSFPQGSPPAVCSATFTASDVSGSSESSATALVSKGVTATHSRPAT